MYIQHAANSGKRERTESGRAESDQMLSCLDWQNQQSAISNQQSVSRIQQESSHFLSMFQYIIGHEDSLDAVAGPETTCKQLRKKKESTRKRSRLP